MEINKITFTPSLLINKSFNDHYTTPQKEIRTTNSLQINNFAYRDYNISFGERLFRSPENFYAQIFNKKYMPDTMKEYLNADYEDRQKMPPAQMMKLVFDDLNNIKKLDFVPRVFPNEPLFKDLTDTPKRNARIGLVSEFEALKSEMDDIPLFKDGTSNLGMYILRKIYLEGKTLSEINKDFKKDLSDDYKDLITSDIDYATTSAYGIKFPKKPFWKSFIVTREDFPYVYKPRKNKDGRLSTDKNAGKTISLINKQYNDEDKRPPKFSTKNFDKKGRRMGDALIDTKNDEKEIRKALRHKGITNDDEISFITKYFGQIMSIALEKIHASEEMHYYFENNENLTKKQRQRMQGYWRENPFMRDYQSLAISDTIKLFYEAYGADGNNDEFRDLLKYAASIKPERLNKKAAHDKRQIELEETFANYEYLDHNNEISPETTVQIEEAPVKIEEDLDALAEMAAIANGAEVIEFDAPSGNKIKYIANIEKLFAEEMYDEFKLMPKKIVDKYIKFAYKSKHATDEYRRTAALIAKIEDSLRNQLMPVEDCLSISARINSDFDKKYPYLMMAAEEALAERIISRMNNDTKKLTLTNEIEFIKFAHSHNIKSDDWSPKELFYLNAMQLIKFADMSCVDIKDWTREERNLLDKAYDKYAQPISSKQEEFELSDAFLKYVHMIKPIQPDNKEVDNLDDMCALFAATLKKYPNLEKDLKKYIRQSSFIKAFGGTARMFLNSELSDEIKIDKAKTMIIQATEDSSNPKLIFDILSRDKDLIHKYIYNSNLKTSLLKYHAFKTFAEGVNP